MQRLPPQALYLITVTVIVLGYFILVNATPTLPLLIASILIIITGMATTIFHGQVLTAEQGSHRPDTRPDSLVTHSLFAYSRNPMYLGYVISLIGWALAFSSVLGWLALTAFIVATDQWYIPLEERAMLLAFGDDYSRYCEETSRWFTVNFK